MVWQGKLFGQALSLHRSFSSLHSFMRIDLASRKVDGLCALDKDDKTLRATLAPSPTGLLAFADSAVLLVDPETRALTVGLAGFRVCLERSRCRLYSRATGQPSYPR